MEGCWPSCHIRTALSPPAVNTVDPSGENAEASTGACPSWFTFNMHKLLRDMKNR